MAHWAQVDENNTVIRVTVGNNNDPDEGYQWLVDNLGGTWIQTSYTSYGGQRYDSITNEPTGQPGFRKNYAAAGFTYDPVLDAFIPPKPTEGNWVLDPETCLWVEVTE